MCMTPDDLKTLMSDAPDRGEFDRWEGGQFDPVSVRLRDGSICLVYPARMVRYFSVKEAEAVRKHLLRRLSFIPPLFDCVRAGGGAECEVCGWDLDAHFSHPDARPGDGTLVVGCRGTTYKL